MNSDVENMKKVKTAVNQLILNDPHLLENDAK
jgi:hypothetical protein